jgi:HNH endonuclease
MKQLTKRDVRRFWAKVDKTPGHGPNGDCWLWMAGHRADYGAFSLGGRMIRAHRLAFRLSGGKLKPGLVVMHTCDVTRCCNPAHLRLGTISDNLRDAYTKGRRRQPTRAVPLTDAELLQLKDEYDHGLSKRALSKKWDLDHTTLRRLLHRALTVTVSTSKAGSVVAGQPIGATTVASERRSGA